MNLDHFSFTSDPWVLQTVSVKAATIQTNFLSGSGGSSTGRKRRQTVGDRDILFIIDSSGSIGLTEFNTAKDNMANLIGKICGTIGRGPQSNRAALINFSNEPHEIFDFDDYDNLADVQDAVRSLTPLANKTCTGNALEYAKTMFEPLKGKFSECRHLSSKRPLPSSTFIHMFIYLFIYIIGHYTHRFLWA